MQRLFQGFVPLVLALAALPIALRAIARKSLAVPPLREVPMIR